MPAIRCDGDLEAVLEAAARGEAITRQLLTYAGRDVVHPLTLDPGASIAALALQLQRLVGDEIRLGFSFEPALWPITIDPSHFEAIVTHLVANGRDAIAGYGVIDLALANVTLGAPVTTALGGVAAGEYVALRVSDTGSGIAEAALPRIFEPFFTTRAARAGRGPRAEQRARRRAPGRRARRGRAHRPWRNHRPGVAAAVDVASARPAARTRGTGRSKAPSASCWSRTSRPCSN